MGGKAMSRKRNKLKEQIIKDAKLCFEQMPTWKRAELISWDSLERPITGKKTLSNKLAKLNKEEVLLANFKTRVAIENRVAKKFAKAGVEVWPEVTAYRAAQIIGCPRSTIVKALRTWRLPGRCVGREHRVRLADLWYFARHLEIKKILSKNRSD